MARRSGRAPNAGSWPSRAISVARRRRDLELQVVLGQAPRQVGQQQVDDAREVFVGQGVEDDDLVDPVQELGPEDAGAACR